MNTLLLAFAISTASADTDETIKSPSLSLSGMRFELNVPLFERGNTMYEDSTDNYKVNRETTYQQVFANSPLQAYAGVAFTSNAEVGLFAEYASVTTDSSARSFYGDGQGGWVEDLNVDSTAIRNLRARVTPALSFKKELSSINANLIATIGYQNEWFSQHYKEINEDQGPETYFFHLQGFLLRAALEKNIKDSDWGVILSGSYSKMYEKEAWYKLDCNYNECSNNKEFEDFGFETTTNMIHVGVSYKL